MTLQEIIGLAINVSIFILVFALGLDASWRDATALFRQPSKLLRSLLAMNIVMLALAVGAALVFDLPAAVKLALIALAASPVPPILPGKQKKAGGTGSYAIGLLCAASLVAIVLVPLSISLVGRIFGLEVVVTAGDLAKIVFLSILLPLAAGILVRQLMPSLAERIARPASLVATLVLVAALIPVIATAWPAFQTFVGNGVIAALIGFTLIGTGVGHALGGPDHDDRTVLALATGARHPAIAMAIASAAGGEPKVMLALMLFHLVIGAVVVLPYIGWRKRREPNLKGA